MDFLKSLEKLSYGKNLSTKEVRNALNQIGDGDVFYNSLNNNDLYFLALTFGMMAKGPTTDELYGWVLSLLDKSVIFPIEIDPDNTIDLSGTGGDKIKTFNVGTATSFVLAACGVCVPKQSTRAYTGKCGSADVFEALGINVFQPRDTSEIEYCLNHLNIAAFHAPSYSKHHNNRVEFLQHLKNLDLKYVTPWHLVSWVCSPINLKYRLYGVFDDKYIEPISKIFERLGFQRTLVVYGQDGLDEISNVGDTFFCEYLNGKHQNYILKPGDFGVDRASISDIEVSTKAESLIDFIRILYNMEKGPKRDLVALNVGGALYVLGKTPSIKEGVKKAFEVMDSGAASEKIEQFVRHFKTESNLEELKLAAGIFTK